ncbi:MAG: signal peptidase I [Gemmatimonadales bacterium]|nr:signal peptidase I [Gemmatimonadales bacterium]
MQSSFVAWLWDWAKSIGVALVVWFFLRTFLVEAFHIPSSSMERTLLVGDWLFVNKALYGAEVPLTGKHLPAVREPRRGDIVVFDSKEQPLKLVKRLIGTPGDTLQMKGGRLIRNGQLVDEPYAVHSDISKSEGPEMRAKMRQWQVLHLAGTDTTGYQTNLQDWGPVVVPRDSLFMMGDNREDSYDSRYWGFLARSSVRGSPMFVYYSFDPSSYRPLPFLTAVRWNRIFHGLH